MATTVIKEIKDTIAVTIDEVFRKMNSISWLEHKKVMKDEAFKNTEKILYCFNILREHVADEREYLDMAYKAKSGSAVRYSETKAAAPEEDQIILNRIASYNRSKTDVERIRKGYEVIKYRYLMRKEKFFTLPM